MRTGTGPALVILNSRCELFTSALRYIIYILKQMSPIYFACCYVGLLSMVILNVYFANFVRRREEIWYIYVRTMLKTVFILN